MLNKRLKNIQKPAKIALFVQPFYLKPAFVKDYWLGVEKGLV